MLALAILFVVAFATVLILVSVYKKEIVEGYVRNVKLDYGLDLHYDQVKLSVFDNWPEVSVTLSNLSLINENKNPKKVPLLKAKGLSLSLSALKVLKREFVINEISVMDGEVLLQKDSAGFTNFKIKEMPVAKDSLSHQSLLQIRKIHLKNMAFDFYNHQKHKHIGMVFERNTIKLDWYGKNIAGNLSGKLKINELLFKPSKGPMFKNKSSDVHFDVVYLQDRKNMFIDKTSQVKIEGQDYDVSGIVFLDTAQTLILDIKADVKDFRQTIGLLTQSVQENLKLVKVKGHIKASALIVAKFNKEQDPQLDLRFEGKNNDVTLGDVKVPYTNLGFTGSLQCLPDSSGIPQMENAAVIIKNITGKVYGFPFRATVTIDNLVTPQLYTNATLEVNASKIKFKAGQDFDLKGNCKANIHYSGPAKGISRATFLKSPMKLVAEASFENFTYKTKTSKLPFVINGKATVVNDSLRFSNLVLKTVGGDFVLKGKAKGFTSYACDLSDAFRADVKASAGVFDITPLLQNTQQQKEKMNTAKAVSQMKKDNFEFNILLDVKKLKIRKLEATNALANLHYMNDIITLRSLEFNSCGGKLSARGSLKDYAVAKANIELKNMNVQTLFEQCENFKQQAIVSENVRGTLSATTAVSVDFDEEFSLRANSLDADVKALLVDGHLLNFEPLQKISDYVFKRRNFEDVSFTEMNPSFTVKSNQMKIEPMEIASNVLNLFVFGTYNFKDESSLNLTIPWSNLKSRGKDYVPKKLAKDGETAKGLKLNVYGYPNKMKIRLGHKE